jgi:hypothetical protein
MNASGSELAEDKQVNILADYQKHLKELVNKSQESFEKQLTYLSAGSLTISMAFIKDVVGDLTKTTHHGLLMTAWSFMGATLLINLLSHVYTSNCHNNTISDISDGKYDFDTAMKRFTNIKLVNYLSIATLILGFFFLLFFIFNNI